VRLPKVFDGKLGLGRGTFSAVQPHSCPVLAHVYSVPPPWHTISFPARRAPGDVLSRDPNSMVSPTKAPLLLLAVAIVIAIVAVLLPPIPQPLAYHNFADQRGWLGIPNFGDVVSNLLFALGGAWGLVFLLRRSEQQRFVDPRERWAYLVVFLGLLLTAIGSSFYHLAPDNARLVWDRLPMTLAFMGLVSAMISERVGVHIGFYSH